MFRPQKKGVAWSPVSAKTASAKGKSVSVGPPPPPMATLGENGAVGGEEDNAESWRRFRKAGLLDEASVLLREREELEVRITELTTELHEYQYNMGLLLIEKKTMTSEYENMQKNLSECKEILNREKLSHLNALRDSEQREDNLRQALSVEKQCVTELERALRELRTEMAETKVSSEKKLSDAHNLEVGFSQKMLEADAKLRSADAKIAESSRTMAQADRKLEDVEAREHKLEKAKQAFDMERQSKERQLFERNEYLQDWNKDLQDRESRLAEAQRFLKEQEERIKLTEQKLNKQKSGLEDSIKLTNSMKATLEEKELDLVLRDKALLLKEKDIESRFAILNKKEKTLSEMEESLKTRETAGLQKLLDDHKQSLEAKARDLDLELEKKRLCFDEELRLKEDAVEKKKKENDLREKDLLSKEESVDNMKKKLEARVQDLDSKSKALKLWEESVKAKEGKLLEDQEHFIRDMKLLNEIRSELEGVKKDVEAQKEEIVVEKQTLIVTKEEREQQTLLMSQLKQQIDDYNMRIKTLSEESENIKQQKQEFEKLWDALDVKRAAFEVQLKQLNDERETFNRLQVSENTRLKNLKDDLESEHARRLEDLERREASFLEERQHAREEINDLLMRERADMSRELESRKHEVEMEMAMKLAKAEEKLLQLQNELRQKIDFVDNKMDHAVKENESKIEKIKVEAEDLRKEKASLLDYRQKLELERSEIKNDIEKLSVLSKNLKDRRERYTKERDRFLELAEQCKSCATCGPLIHLYNADHTEMTNLPFQDPSNSPNSRLVDTRSAVNSAGPLSIIKRCAMFFNVSPGKPRDGTTSSNHKGKSVSFGERLEDVVPEQEKLYEPTPVFAPVGDFDADKLPSRSGYADEPELSDGVAENSVDIQRVQLEEGSLDTACNQIGNDECVDLPGTSSQPEIVKDNQVKPKRRGRPKAVKRTRSVRTVVEEARAILGEKPEVIDDGQVAGQKRRFDSLSGVSASELEAGDSEAHSDSISVGGQRRKRQQTSGLVAPEKRYNLREKPVKSAKAGAVGKTKARKSTGRVEVVIHGEGDSKVPADGMQEYDPGKMAVTGLVEEQSSQNMIQVQVDDDGIQVQDGNTNNEVEREGDAPATALQEEAEPATPSQSGLAGHGEEDEEDDEDDKKDRSIGKKLWTFFTT